MRYRARGRGMAADAVIVDETHTMRQPAPWERLWVDELRADRRDRRGYDTSMHYPYCRDGGCTGCLPPVSRTVTLAMDAAPAGPAEGSALGVTDAQRADPAKLWADWANAGWRFDAAAEAMLRVERDGERP